ncbi:MAG: bifunctional 5,10-methylenetetrahydrofolate dehydrogenase/5,10-methenyltetrahydrofolate cyclohydrolase [Oscillospiraceae bacterium]|nr:bifunctional 5,10-methylenetetrahydrofolate dehydrogenase/5,10-methenyltetrahydrofolate cyclohydrolase [Oscillospiraceae bacterium]
MVRLRGAPAADYITAHVNADAAQLELEGVTPRLAVVRVGENPDDIAYENAAVKRCGKTGVAVKQVTLPGSATQEAVIAMIDWLNQDGSVHGVLILRPLPKHIDEAAVCAALSPEKDVDGITTVSLGGVFAGYSAGFPPCTAQACIELLEYYNYGFAGKRAVVVGRSLSVGKPVSMLLLNRHATVTVCHTRTLGLRDICREAELLIVAAGVKGVVEPSFIAPGQTVVDVGIHVGEDGKLSGDVVIEGSEAEAYTPVPGGVGSVTTAVLVKHVVEAARRQTKG